MALDLEPLGETSGILRVGGDVRPENIEGYRKKLYEVCEQKNYILHIDMTGVEHLSSWAIGVTALAAQKIRQNGGDLKIYAAGENLKRILKFSRLEMIIDSGGTAPPSGS
ncbi:STAS domain-containing protein [bacterium]|nr:STAS domain-containing protein [bacterium]